MDRHIRYSRAGLNSGLPKISPSGRKRTVVPRRLWIAPAFFSRPTALPRSKAWVQRVRSRATSTSSRSLSALTTEEPTPCSPPEVW